ncbi:MAG: hypothetical protein ACI4AN_00615 [Muribaculaceae bacterium]
MNGKFHRVKIIQRINFSGENVRKVSFFGVSADLHTFFHFSHFFRFFTHSRFAVMMRRAVGYVFLEKGHPRHSYCGRGGLSP